MHVDAEFLSPYEAVLLRVKVQDSALLWLREAGSSFSTVKDEMFTFAVNFPLTKHFCSTRFSILLLDCEII